jgi:hypothetical protein
MIKKIVEGQEEEIKQIEKERNTRKITRRSGAWMDVERKGKCYGRI